MSDDDFLPDWASPPGDTIQTVLRERNESKENFAQAMAMPVAWAEELLTGKVAIDEAVAAKLAQVLGSTKRFWLAREQCYRDDLARLSKQQG